MSYNGNEQLRHRYIGTLLMGAIGDAAGWPYEFNHLQAKSGDLSFKSWQKMIGGYWWGTREVINPGEYSDDTQLTLAIARSIDDYGIFHPDEFSYEELPLWLQYERGGGRSTKGAIRNLITRKRSTWSSNFYKFQEVDYRNAGANGAAMRVAPLVLLNMKNFNKLCLDIFSSIIPTHGHPRAILGTVLVALTLYNIINDNRLSKNNVKSILMGGIIEFIDVIKRDHMYISWASDYNEKDYSIDSEIASTISEISDYLDMIPKVDSLDEFIIHVGADRPETKGSGISSMIVSIYTYLNNLDNLSVNTLTQLAYRNGIDTDTSASVLGWFIGATLGHSFIPTHIKDGVQDSRYIAENANRLWKLADLASEISTGPSTPLDTKSNFLSRLWAWDIGLYEMFWESITEGSYVHHPALGRGNVIKKSASEVNHKKSGGTYQRVSVTIAFDIGQTCTFSTRMLDGHLPESGLAAYVAKYFE